MVEAIRYAGNISVAIDPDKAAHAGLEIEAGKHTPILSDCPVHYDCKVTGEIRLGTHAMFLGEVQRIRVRHDVTPENPLRWFPLADVDVETVPTFGLVQETTHA